MYIHVKVITNSRKETITKEGDVHYVMHIRQPAERNLANKRIIEIISVLYPTMKYIRIISGHHSSSKIISVEEKR